MAGLSVYVGRICLTYITVEEKQFKKASLLVGTNSNEALSSLGEKIYFCCLLNIVVDQWAIEIPNGFYLVLSFKFT